MEILNSFQTETESVREEKTICSHEVDV